MNLQRHCFDWFYLNRSRTACSTFSFVSASRCIAGTAGAAIASGAGEEYDCERRAEMLMHTDAPHDGQRAVSVRSSTERSEEKSNELAAPHLQGTYFLRETMASPQEEGSVN